MEKRFHVQTMTINEKTNIFKNLINEGIKNLTQTKTFLKSKKISEQEFIYKTIEELSFEGATSFALDPDIREDTCIIIITCV